MGGAVSAGESNDELIDNLVSAEYIKSPTLERVFRSVDRGFYYEPTQRDSAYRDIAWKHGNLHLSAPCIYSEVMRSLDLRRGQSFLNLGSGTGYVSTMVGLLLGPYGTNHGIEFHEDVVEYANERLREFLSTSPSLDQYDGFAVPKFFHGNCLNLDTTYIRLYDRVYCGAGVPPDYENHIKKLIAVEGVLVMPFNDNLVQITRTGENSWRTKNILPVSFATLIPPGPSDALIHLDNTAPMRLQDLCRLSIRNTIRSKLKVNEHLAAIYKRRRVSSESKISAASTMTASKLARVILPGDDEYGGNRDLTVRISFPLVPPRNDNDPDNDADDRSRENGGGSSAPEHRVRRQRRLVIAGCSRGLGPAITAPVASSSTTSSLGQQNPLEDDRSSSVAEAAVAADTEATTYDSDDSHDSHLPNRNRVHDEEIQEDMNYDDRDNENDDDTNSDKENVIYREDEHEDEDSEDDEDFIDQDDGDVLVRRVKKTSSDRDSRLVAVAVSRQMQTAIKSLPLPTFLKLYLNLDRPFTI